MSHNGVGYEPQGFGYEPCPALLPYSTLPCFCIPSLPVVSLLLPFFPLLRVVLPGVALLGVAFALPCFAGSPLLSPDAVSIEVAAARRCLVDDSTYGVPSICLTIL